MYKYYRRPTNKQRMGEYVHLCNKAIQWEENHEPLDPKSFWTPRAGKIKNAGIKNGSLGYYVENSDDFTLHWIDEAWEMYRNIQVEGL